MIFFPSFMAFWILCLSHIHVKYYMTCGGFEVVIKLEM